MGVCTGKEVSVAPTPGIAPPNSSIVFPTNLCGTDYADIHESYIFLKLLGRGSFGIVREAVCRLTGYVYAVKSINKLRLKAHAVTALQREMQILLSLHHLNIVTCYEVLEDSKYIHIIMERCTGGDLFQRVMNGYVRTEGDLSAIFQKICSAVRYLHNNNICHRDLKPENILFSSSGTDAEVKIIDFGLARYSYDTRMDSFVGSPYYMAPEVLRGDYGLLCDVWSLGVLLYLFLHGKTPFSGKGKSQLFEAILNEKVDLSQEGISDEAKDLLRMMLEPREDLRPALSQILKHEWFTHSPSLTDDEASTKPSTERRGSQRQLEIEVQ